MNILHLVFGVVSMAVLLLAQGHLAAAEASPARLLVAKTYTPVHVVQGRPTVVRYALYNMGEGVARQVTLTEDGFPTGMFAVMDGSLRTTIDEIPGFENATHTVTLMPTQTGVFMDVPARVTYHDGPDSSEKVMLSSSYGPMKVLSEVAYHQTVLQHWHQWGLFAMMSLVPTLVPYLWYRQKFASLGLSADTAYAAQASKGKMH